MSKIYIFGCGAGATHQPGRKDVTDVEVLAYYAYREACK